MRKRRAPLPRILSTTVLFFSLTLPLEPSRSHVGLSAELLRELQTFIAVMQNVLQMCPASSQCKHFLLLFFSYPFPGARPVSVSSFHSTSHNQSFTGFFLLFLLFYCDEFCGLPCDYRTDGFLLSPPATANKDAPLN